MTHALTYEIAAFIAAAPTDIDALIAEVRRLRILLSATMSAGTAANARAVAAEAALAAVPMFVDQAAAPAPGPSGKYGWAWRLDEPAWGWEQLDGIRPRTLRLV